ncbi:MAG: GyrI-like domain-containing protein [Defluviitaleaceae bacterium]|nr:GyrI-like domain-containing protein [Defluviitaleaceae bacterium]
MKMYIENIPQSHIAYMRRVGVYGEQNYKLMQDMKRWVHERDLWNSEGVIYGIAQDNAAQTLPEKCRYDVCFVTNSVFEDEFIHYGMLPTGKYLVCEIIHTADEVQHFYSNLMSVLSIEGERIDESRPILERYQFLLVEKGYCEICVPIL